MGFAGERQIDMEERTAAPSGLRRGACPTLAAPMVTGDGLLVRLRPAGGALSLAQFKALAASAVANGNGLLEITARGNLQIRGLRTESVEQLAADIDAAGIIVPAGPAIELSPLHGIDPSEAGNAAAMEAKLRDELSAALSSSRLAPKLSIIVDGGGRFGLSGLAADIRAVAMDDGRWLVATDGDGMTVQPVSVGSANDAVRAIGQLLEMLAEAGLHARARDIKTAALRDGCRAIAADFAALPQAEMPQPGIHELADVSVTLGLRPRFGQMQAGDLSALLQEAERLGGAEIRLAPGRLLFVTSLEPENAKKLRAASTRHGFSYDPSEASANIAACAGAGACASGLYETRGLAQDLLQRAEILLDGSLTVHLSGCAKGCAHPRPALTLTGVPGGYGIVLNGRANDRPDVTIAGGEINLAIEKLARLIGKNKSAGESAAACLARLGAPAIAAALRQE